VEISEPKVEDKEVLEKCIGEFIDHFPELGLSKEEILKGEFIRLAPKSKRPYAKMYA
jgi:hypothetical protein